MSELSELCSELRRLAEAIESQAKANQAQTEALNRVLVYLLEAEGAEEPEQARSTYLDGRPK